MLLLHHSHMHLKRSLPNHKTWCATQDWVLDEETTNRDPVPNFGALCTSARGANLSTRMQVKRHV